MRTILLLAFAATLALAPPLPAGCPQAAGVVSKLGRADEVVLRWEGHFRLGKDDTERCQRLIITADNQAQYGKCSERPRTGTVPFDKMVRQFSPFEYRSPDTTLSFKGRGMVVGEVWQRAIAAWARDTFAEMYGGRLAASARNVLEWSAGPVPTRAGYRGMLVVFNYGYALKIEAPIEGVNAVRVAEDWLTTEEWTQLDKWIETGAAQNFGKDNFIGGRGAKKRSPPELDAIRQWARKLYYRLQQE